MHDAPVGGIGSPVLWGVSACGSKEIIVLISQQVKEVSFTSVT